MSAGAMAGSHDAVSAVFRFSVPGHRPGVTPAFCADSSLGHKEVTFPVLTSEGVRHTACLAVPLGRQLWLM